MSRKADSVRLVMISEGNPLAISMKGRLKSSTMGSDIEPESLKSMAESKKIKTENLSDAKIIRPPQLQQIIEKMIKFETNEELLDYIEFQRKGFLFTSDYLLQMIKAITSVKTRIAIIEMIGPRLTDPKSKMEEIMNVFRYSEDKEKVEEILKTRSATLTSQMFRTSGRGSHNSSGNRTGKGRGGLHRNQSSEGGMSMRSTMDINDFMSEAIPETDTTENNITLSSSKSEITPTVSPRTIIATPSASAKTTKTSTLSAKTASTPISAKTTGITKATSPLMAKHADDITEHAVSEKSPLFMSTFSTAMRVAPADYALTQSNLKQYNGNFLPMTPPENNKAIPVVKKTQPPAAPQASTTTTPVPAKANGKSISPTATSKVTPSTTATTTTQPNAAGTGRILHMAPICPGLVVKIRPNPSAADPHIAFIRSGEEVEVYSNRVSGFFKLVDGRGYFNKNTIGVTWSISEAEAEYGIDSGKALEIDNNNGAVSSSSSSSSSSAKSSQELLGTTGAVSSKQQLVPVTPQNATAGGAGNSTKSPITSPRDGVPLSPTIYISNLSLSRLKQLNMKPRHQGVLLKLSDWLKSWRPRYFAIYGTRLFICSDPHPSELDEPKVEIDFSHPSPNLTVIINMVKDKYKGGNATILELKMTKIKDRPKGLVVRSACTQSNEARDDLTAWMNAILETSRGAAKLQTDSSNKTTTALTGTSTSIPSVPSQKSSTSSTTPRVGASATTSSAMAVASSGTAASTTTATSVKAKTTSVPTTPPPQVLEKVTSKRSALGFLFGK